MLGIDETPVLWMTDGSVAIWSWPWKETMVKFEFGVGRLYDTQSSVVFVRILMFVFSSACRELDNAVAIEEEFRRKCGSNVPNEARASFTQ